MIFNRQILVDRDIKRKRFLHTKYKLELAIQINVDLLQKCKTKQSAKIKNYVRKGNYFLNVCRYIIVA